MTHATYTINNDQDRLNAISVKMQITGDVHLDVKACIPVVSFARVSSRVDDFNTRN